VTPRPSRAVAPAGVALVAVAPVLPGRRTVARLDRRLLAGVVARRPDGLRGPAVRLTALAEPAAVLPVCAVAAMRALGRGTPPREVVGPLVRAAAGIVLRRALAETVRRPRPPAGWWWHPPSGFSYPSRHVTWAALGFAVAADLCGGGAYRAAADVVTAGVVATRVLLAVHWPSDVAAALLLAAAWRRLRPAQA
jgi:undecaprenyl-diphosphatase